jgi:Fe2+ or Zn2+ uptake regulation protein
MLDFRAKAVLNLLVGSGLALPPTPIYENLRLKGETFSKRTVHRKLGTLVDEGYVEKVLDGKGYYRATEAGRDLIEDQGHALTERQGHALAEK